MPATESSNDSNRPFHEIRHRRIRATIWKNETTKGPMYKVTVTRSYREDDRWKDTHSFGFDDLMNVAKALYDAHSFIAAQEARDREQARPAPRDRGRAVR